MGVHVAMHARMEGSRHAAMQPCQYAIMHQSAAIRHHPSLITHDVIYSVKVVGSVDSPAAHLIAVINECDLLPTFMTMVKLWGILHVHSRTHIHFYWLVGWRVILVRPLLQVSKFSKVIWMKIKMPPLFDDRDICFEG